MPDRRVTATRKSNDGDILELCGGPTAYWSPRSKGDVISDIEHGEFNYYVLWMNCLRTDIRVVSGPNGKHLRTDRDRSSRNNLDELPDC